MKMRYGLNLLLLAAMLVPVSSVAAETDYSGLDLGINLISAGTHADVDALRETIEQDTGLVVVRLAHYQSEGVWRVRDYVADSGENFALESHQGLWATLKGPWDLADY